MKHALLVSVVQSLVLAVPCTAQDQGGSAKKAEVKKVETFELNKTVKKAVAIDINAAPINTADAQTIAKILDIDEKVAEAVVARRTKLGPLESTDDLLVVPGVSRATVTANFAKLGLPQGKIKLDVKPAKDAADKPRTEVEKKKKAEAATEKVKKDLDKQLE